jgi:hypothetical protein
MPYMKVKSGNTVCVHKQNADKSAGEKLHCYTGSDADSKADAYMRALYANVKDASINFMFTELGDPKPFDGMAAGKFTDMTGQVVTIKSSDLPSIVERTKASIESTRTESGEIVGLPIDEDGHNHAGGAGWIVDIAMDESGSKIRFTPKWTEIGLKLISENIRRFFSVSVDLVNKVILGGSLTNWPASRTKEGKILLRPIELSVAMFAIDESLSERLQSIRNAFYAQFNPSNSMPIASSPSLSIYLDKIFDEFVICQEGDNLFKVPYSTTDGKIEFASHDKWVKVKITYKEISMSPQEGNIEEVKTGLSKIADQILNFVKPTKPEGETLMTDPVTPVTPVTPVPAPAAAPATPAPVQLSQTVSPNLIELLQTPEAVQELGRRAEAIAKDRVDAEVRKQKIVEYASTLVGGTKDFPYGIPVRAEEVVALLCSLPPQQAEAVQIMLSKTMKAINFKELGFSGEYNAHPRLSEEYRTQLKVWMDAGKDLSSFFKTNPEVGKEEDFNLREFVKEQ